MGTKTIIITALPSKQGAIAIHRPATAPKRPLMEVAAPPAVPRKRERLTHLTAEEKLNRRKLKNRIAAQTARDRKKLRMNRLEETTESMQAENDALAEENEALRSRNAALEAERAELQAQLTALKEARGETQPTKTTTTLGSAASISAPLPWDQVAALPQPSVLLHLLSTLLTLSSSSSSPTTTLPPATRASLEETQATLQKGLPLSPPQLQQLAELWRRARKK